MLGAGGSALAASVALAEGEASRVNVVGRTPERCEHLKSVIEQTNDSVEVVIGDEDLLSERAGHISCLINTTPVGMSPDTRDCPLTTKVTDTLFEADTVVFDLIYNPLKTILQKRAEKQGCTTINGLQMLVAQAVYSVEIWMGGNIVTHVDINALVRDLEKTIK
jgi:shikimate dehydrogenase